MLVVDRHHQGVFTTSTQRLLIGLIMTEQAMSCFEILSKNLKRLHQWNNDQVPDSQKVEMDKTSFSAYS